MKRFLLKTVVFCSAVSLIFLWILSTADGYTDPFYIRFTTPKQSNLILGTSRAAQALQPSVFRAHLDRDLFNYSFTIAHSSYGPTYLQSVKKKLNENSTDGIFIVTVDPWSVSSNTSNPNDSTNFSENHLCVGTTHLVDVRPNFEYLFKNLAGKYYTLLYKTDRTIFLHDDGWLEIDVPMDSTSISNRQTYKILDYRKNYLPRFKVSPIRIEYLKRTMQFLKKHGKVFLVRLPVHPRLYEIEQELLPNLDNVLSPLFPLANGYLDMTDQNREYQYTDGNHLYKESGKVVSQRIAKWIKETND